MADTPTLARFVHGYVLEGVGVDGLPLYRDVVQIHLSRPPYLEVTREATEQDQVDYAHPWQLFQREQKGRVLDAKAGYPLVMWPALSPSEVRMCADREIFTVEDLAKLAVKAGAEVPAQIVELAKRAKRMIELSKETGRHEMRVTELEGQIGALREENNELKAKNEAQRITIATMAARQAA